VARKAFVGKYRPDVKIIAYSVGKFRRCIVSIDPAAAQVRDQKKGSDTKNIEVFFIHNGNST
jgi:hypothetical protein